MNKTDLKKIVHKSKSYDYYYDEDENAFLPVRPMPTQKVCPN